MTTLSSSTKKKKDKRNKYCRSIYTCMSIELEDILPSPWSVSVCACICLFVWLHDWCSWIINSLSPEYLSGRMLRKWVWGLSSHRDLSYRINCHHSLVFASERNKETLRECSKHETDLLIITMYIHRWVKSVVKCRVCLGGTLREGFGVFRFKVWFVCS